MGNYSRTLRYAVWAGVVVAGMMFPSGCTGDSEGRERALETIERAERARKDHGTYADTAALADAVDYFERTGDLERTGAARYYRGLCELGRDCPERAVEDALGSCDASEKSGSGLYEARARELLADTYRAAFNLRMARLHRRKAFEAYLEAGRRDNAFYAAMDLAGEYSHEVNDSSLFMMETARGLLPRGQEERMHYELLYSDIDRVRGDYAGALGHFRSIGAAWRGRLLTAEDSVHIGEIYYYAGQPDSAFMYFSTPAAAASAQYWECMADGHERKGAFREALSCLRKARDLGYAEASASLSNSLEAVERGFYERKAAVEKRRHDRLVSAVVVSLSAIALTALLWLLMRYYRRSRRLKAENEILDVALMSSEAVESDSCGDIDTGPEKEPSDRDSGKDETEREKWVNVILDFHMSRLNAISKEYFKVSDERSLGEIRAEFDRELRSVRGSDIFEEIERNLNEREDGIVRRIRSAFPKFNEQYVRLMMCSLAGLSSQSACLLMSVEKGNYYVMWTRIRNRIRESGSVDRELFMKHFCRRQ